MKHLSSLFSSLLLICLPLISFSQDYTVSVLEHAVDIVEGHTTYRMYIDMVNPEDKLSSISGGGDTPLALSTTDGFYNDPFGVAVGSAINPILYSFFPTMLADSWITIGIESNAVGDQAAVSVVEGDIPLTAHFAEADPLSGTDLLIDDSTGSAWYVLSDASNGLPDANMRTMFMQITIPTGGEICATINVQIFGMGIGANEILATFSYCGVGTFAPVSNEVVPGCTDSFACNYNPLATEDDGSCDYMTCMGCTDVDACNFDAEALYEDGSCEYDSCGTGGCTNALACNYNAEATFEDGTCEFTSCVGCTDANAANYDPAATIDNGSCEFPGCTDMTACNYDVDANSPDGSCTYASEGYDCDGNCLADVDGDGTCDEFEIAGCTDAAAPNYNPEATDEDGSCAELTFALSLQGIIDFTVPTGGNDGKAIHLVASADVADLSSFGIGVANNGGGTDGEEYSFPVASVSAGDDILVVRSVAAMEAYFADCYSEFEHVFLDEGGSISQNGDDAIELFEWTAVIETFGDINVDGTGQDWEYLDSWAYQVDGVWTYGAVNCTDGTTTTFDSSCPYPLCPLPVQGCTDVVACNYDADAAENDGSCDYCSCGDSGGLLSGLEYTMTIEEHAADLVAGTVTYRFYANMVNGDDFLSSVYGNNENPFALETSDGFYNSTFGGTTADQVNPAFFSFFPDLIADSWVTIGIESTPVGSQVAISTVESSEQPWVNAFASGSAIDGQNVVMDDETGGAWFVLNGSPNGLPDAVNNRVLFMQLTTAGTFSGTAHIQVFVSGNGADDVRSSFDFDGVGTYNPNTGGGGGNACGCTDPVAANYDENALYDDGSCDYSLYGCTDMLACNFDETANAEDGSCEYPEAGYDCNGNCSADADMDGICDEFEIPGCTISMACNYDETATDDDGSCTVAVVGYDCDGNCLADADDDGVCDEYEVGGCTDMVACNYDVAATDDNGACEYAVTNYDCEGNCLADADGDGVCDALEVTGCTDMMACSYNADATDDDGSCTYAEANYDCEGNCLNDADMDGVCDELEVTGCTDMSACNYNADATDDDESCTYAEENYDCDGNCLNDADMDGVCDELEVAGCTDMTACNYNEEATDDDGTCVFAEVNYDCDGNCLNDADGDGICDELEVAGCTDPAAENYNADATDDDGSCYFCDVLIVVDEVVNDVEGAGGSISITISGGTPDYVIGWTGPDGFTSEDEDITGTGGLYTVTVTDSNGCVTTLDVEMEVVISVMELTSFPMNAYPNPATNELWIASPEWSDAVEVSIYDATGRMVFHRDMQAANGAIRLDVAGYAHGIYNVSVRSGMKRAMEQVIIQ
jgi:hypothetical protein